MKFLAFLLSVVLILSFSVTAFADEVLELTLPDLEPKVEVQEEEHPATTNNEYLDMVLNGMQNQIGNLNEKVEGIEDELSQINESNTLPDSSTSNVVQEEEIIEFNPETELPNEVVLMSVAPITPDDSTGLKAILLEILGDYDPVIVEYRYQNTNQTSYQYLREVLPDYPWCASFFIFALLIYCTFRIGGALLHG